MAEIPQAAAATEVAAARTTGAGRPGVRLEPSCLLRDAADMQFQLLAADFGGDEALLDGSAVERIDTAGLQLLIGFVRYQEARGKRVGWTAASPELLRCGERLGLLESIRLNGAAVAGSAT